MRLEAIPELKIAALIQMALALHLFGRGVTGVAGRDARFSIVGRIEGAGLRKIRQFAEAVGAEQDGFRRDAAMHEGLLVDTAKSFQQLTSDVEGFLPRQRALLETLGK